MIQLQNLNHLLSTGDYSYIVSNNIDTEFFSDYANEFNFIREHYEKYGKVPDQITFCNKFPDFDIIEVTETSRYLIDGLYEDLNKRKLAKVFNNIRKLLMEDKVEAAQNLYISQAASVVKSSKMESVDIFQDVSRYDAYIEKTNDVDKFYVSTGFLELDNVLSGWDRQDEYATIVARTGRGKSWILLKTAVAAAQQGLTVGVYSGEMSVDNVAYRVDTWISHISNGSLVHGNAIVKEEYSHYIKQLPTMFKGSIKVLTPDMITGKSGVNAMRAFIEKEKLDMLCIDQHSLLEDDRNARNPVEKAANISKDIKILQTQKRIPIITVSQQNRNVMDNGGVDSVQISSSDRIGQDSSTILFLTKEENIMTLHLVKSRNSESGKSIRYACDWNRGIVEYIAEENNAVDGAGSAELRAEYEIEDGDNVF